MLNKKTLRPKKMTKTQKILPQYEKIYLGTELRIARAKLRGLDAWLQKALLELLV